MTDDSFDTHVIHCGKLKHPKSIDRRFAGPENSSKHKARKLPPLPSFVYLSSLSHCESIAVSIVSLLFIHSIYPVPSHLVSSRPLLHSEASTSKVFIPFSASSPGQDRTGQDMTRTSSKSSSDRSIATSNIAKFAGKEQRTKKSGVLVQCQGALLLGFLRACLYYMYTYICAVDQDRSCRGFPLVDLALCWGISLVDGFSVLLVLVSLVTLSSVANKSGGSFRDCDYRETIVQRIIRNACEIAVEFRRAIRVQTVLLVLRTTLLLTRSLRFIGMVLTRSLRFIGTVLCSIWMVLQFLIFCLAYIVVGLIVTIVARSLHIVLAIAIRVMQHLEFTVHSTIWLLCKILHF